MKIRDVIDSIKYAFGFPPSEGSSGGSENQPKPRSFFSDCFPISTLQDIVETTKPEEYDNLWESIYTGEDKNKQVRDMASLRRKIGFFASLQKSLYNHYTSGLRCGKYELVRPFTDVDAMRIGNATRAVSATRMDETLDDIHDEEESEEV